VGGGGGQQGRVKCKGSDSRINGNREAVRVSGGQIGGWANGRKGGGRRSRIGRKGWVVRKKKYLEWKGMRKKGRSGPLFSSLESWSGKQK